MTAQTTTAQTGPFSPEAIARASAEMGEPEWLRRWRLDAYERFSSLPWPDQSREEWRHTELTGFDLEEFSPERPAPWGAEVKAQEGLSFGPLARAHDEARTWLGHGGVSDFEEKLYTLNAAFCAPMFIRIAPHVRVAEPIVLRFSSAAGAAILPRVVVVAGAGSDATVIQSFEGGDGEALCVPVVEIYAEDGAIVNQITLQDWPQTVWHFGILRALVGRDATVRTLNATIGGRFSRSVVQSILEGQGAHAEMLGVYFGDHAQHIDNRTLQAHRGANTSSELFYKGALKGTSRAIYSGLVDIEKEATRSDAQQANRNLLLSPGASALPNPFLEIKTSEVARATHGVSVGRPDANVLFYLRSRGLAPDAAERLYVKGFFQEIIDRVRVGSVRAVLEDAVEAELELDDD